MKIEFATRTLSEFGSRAAAFSFTFQLKAGQLRIQKARLIDEVIELKDRVDPLTWAAIDAVRSVGNIGAHMEKDINVIIEVDSDEASKLIGLIELLIRDWYILRHERQTYLAEIVEIAKAKKQVKQAPTPNAAPNPTESKGE